MVNHILPCSLKLRGFTVARKPNKSAKQNSAADALITSMHIWHELGMSTRMFDLPYYEESMLYLGPVQPGNSGKLRTEILKYAPRERKRLANQPLHAVCMASKPVCMMGC